MIKLVLFGLYFIVTQSQCPHCSFIPQKYCLKNNCVLHIHLFLTATYQNNPTEISTETIRKTGSATNLPPSQPLECNLFSDSFPLDWILE